MLQETLPPLVGLLSLLGRRLVCGLVGLRLKSVFCFIVVLICECIS